MHTISSLQQTDMGGKVYQISLDATEENSLESNVKLDTTSQLLSKNASWLQLLKQKALHLLPGKTQSNLSKSGLNIPTPDAPDDLVALANQAIITKATRLAEKDYGTLSDVFNTVSIAGAFSDRQRLELCEHIGQQNIAIARVRARRQLTHMVMGTDEQQENEACKAQTTPYPGVVTKEQQQLYDYYKMKRKESVRGTEGLGFFGPEDKYL